MGGGGGGGGAEGGQEASKERYFSSTTFRDPVDIGRRRKGGRKRPHGSTPRRTLPRPQAHTCSVGSTTVGTVRLLGLCSACLHRFCANLLVTWRKPPHTSMLTRAGLTPDGHAQSPQKNTMAIKPSLCLTSGDKNYRPGPGATSYYPWLCSRDGILSASHSTASDKWPSSPKFLTSEMRKVRSKKNTERAVVIEQQRTEA